MAARVEKKNITYNYGTRNHGVRGRKLGKLYDKKGLEETFKGNDERFGSIPGLRQQVRGLVADAQRGNGDQACLKKSLSSISGTTYEQGYKNYGHFTKVARPGRVQTYPHELDVSTSIIPIEEIRRARNANILAYCRANKIALESNNEGRTVIKGREFVEVSEFAWVNKRNRTRGSLIEFVAAHKQMTLLQAVAEINSNPRLLLLEQHLGETKRNFVSFYIPKEKQLRELDAKVKIAELLTSRGADPHHASLLFKSGQAQVGASGLVRLFGKDDEGGAFEFTEHRDGNWSKGKVGKINRAFFHVATQGRKMSVYVDPFSFLKAQGKHALWPTKYRECATARTL